MATKKKNFEASLHRLEEIVALLEKGETPLEESLALFEEGTGLVQTCSALLDQAEQKVVRLTKGPDGTPEEQPFGEE